MEIVQILFRENNKVCKLDLSDEATDCKCWKSSVVRQVKFAILVVPTQHKLQDFLHLQCVSRSLAEAYREPSRSWAALKLA